jgi:SSS family solute:Na+ symporter
MHLKSLDFIVVAVYLLGLFLLGVFFSRRQASKADYFLGGRKIPWFLAGVSAIATLLSTVSYLSLPGEMIKNGVGFFTNLLAFIFIIPVVIHVVIPALMRLPVISVYDYLERRFGVPARTLGAAVFVLMRLVWMGLILYTASRAVKEMTGWEIPKIVAVIGIVTIFYTTLGGMKAVVWSDLVQFMILLGGAVFIPVYVGFMTGDGPGVWWEEFSQAERSQTPIFSFDPTQRTSVLGMMMLVFMWNICTHSSDQVAAQRYLSTSSAGAARRSFWVFCVANVGLTLLLMVVGLALFHFDFQQSSLTIPQFQADVAARADDVLPQFIAKQLPAGLSGLMLAALLAAAMSSLSSGINSISAVVVTDLLPESAGAKSGEGSLRLPMVLAAAAGLVGMGTALLVNQLMLSVEWNLIDMIEKINHLFVAPLGALFFAGIWFRRAGLAAALLGFFAGVLTSFLVSFSGDVFDYDISFMWIMPGAFVVSLAVTYVTGYVFKPATREQLKALYQGESGE